MISRGRLTTINLREAGYQRSDAASGGRHGRGGIPG